ncbi:unnamed protein product [Penicillium roqueforti FM164]|uniref:Uncharacterized protein n=1 Tax=Penicillium roqueforti (strain FM164) TaxID=1365484 RepID=W6QLF9_PENRF|nr:unnamed protein product [Penicillium roqueforti FM164]
MPWVIRSNMVQGTRGPYSWDLEQVINTLLREAQSCGNLHSRGNLYSCGRLNPAGGSILREA